MRAGLEIAFFGSSLVSAYWNGAATYYRGILRALARRGHRITFYEPDAYGRQEHRDIADPEWARVVVYPGEGEEGVLRALESARSADLVVKASGVGVFDAFLEREVLALRRPEMMVVFWDVDAPATLERVRNDAADEFRELIPRYDLVFTYGGGEPVVREYEGLGARGCVPIYNALDPDTHYPVAAEPRFEGDLGFLGHRLPDREARVEEFFLGVAARLPDRRFMVGGSLYPADFAWSPNIHYKWHVPPPDHPVFYCSAPLVLNVTRRAMAQMGYCPSGRLFEAAACGVPVVSDVWPGLEECFEPGTEILLARSAEDVIAALALSREELARIGSAARERALSEHTAERRALQLLNALEDRR